MIKKKDGKNNDTTDIINYTIMNEFNQVRQQQIQECIRQFGINTKMLNDLKKAFLSCNLDKNHCTTNEQLLLKMRERELKYRPEIINFFLSALAVQDVYADGPRQQGRRGIANAAAARSVDPSGLVSFRKLQSIQNIQNNCPMLTQEKRNNSVLIKQSIFNETSEEAVNSRYSLKEKIHM